MVILEEDQERLSSLLGQLVDESNSKIVFLVDTSGQQLASAGDLDGVDPTALASLTAGNVAATEGLAQQIGEQGFSSLYHEGDEDSLHLSMVGEKVILLVIFDEKSSLGLVRLRVKQRTPELVSVVEEVLNRGDGQAAAVSTAAFADISDEDIDALFG